MTSLSLFTSMHWRRKWQPTPVFLPGESQGRESLLLLLLLRRFSRVRLCTTPYTAAHQALLSLGLSRDRTTDCPGKNTGVGCHFLLQCMEVKSESEVAQVVYLKVTQSCLTPSNPTDCSLPGSSIHGIFQARVLEWGAIAFSDILYTLYHMIPLI